MTVFLLKLFVIIGFIWLIHRAYPQEFQKFPLRELPFFLIPAVTLKNWKESVFLASILLLNTFLTLFIGKKRTEGERVFLFFLFFFLEMLVLTLLIKHFKFQQVDHSSL